MFWAGESEPYTSAIIHVSRKLLLSPTATGVSCNNTLQLTNDQLLDEIYYRQPFIDAGQQYFFPSLQLKNDDDDG